MKNNVTAILLLVTASAPALAADTVDCVPPAYEPKSGFTRGLKATTEFVDSIMPTTIIAKAILTVIPGKHKRPVCSSEDMMKNTMAAHEENVRKMNAKKADISGVPNLDGTQPTIASVPAKAPSEQTPEATEPTIVSGHADSPSKLATGTSQPPITSGQAETLHEQASEKAAAPSAPQQM